MPRRTRKKSRSTDVCGEKHSMEEHQCFYMGIDKKTKIKTEVNVL